MNKNFIKSIAYSNLCYIGLFIFLYTIHYFNLLEDLFFGYDPVFNTEVFYFWITAVCLFTVALLLFKFIKLEYETFLIYFQDLLFSLSLFGIFMLINTLLIIDDNTSVIILYIIAYLLFCLIISYIMYYLKNKKLNHPKNH